jgi:hypothetical protein
MASDDAASRRSERLENAAYHAAQHERRKAEEGRRAGALLEQFARDAVAAGLTPQPLQARPYSGSGTYRTDVVGWYLRRDHSLGVDTSGRYYVLVVPRSLRSRLGRAHVPPTDPPLVVGAGGRDGESIPLPDLLQLRLEAGDAFG